jgi:hypothetical protein
LLKPAWHIQLRHRHGGGQLGQLGRVELAIVLTISFKLPRLSFSKSSTTSTRSASRCIESQAHIHPHLNFLYKIKKPESVKTPAQ